MEAETLRGLIYRQLDENCLVAGCLGTCSERKQWNLFHLHPFAGHIRSDRAAFKHSSALNFDEKLDLLTTKSQTAGSECVHQSLFFSVFFFFFASVGASKTSNKSKSEVSWRAPEFTLNLTGGTAGHRKAG